MSVLFCCGCKQETEHVRIIAAQKLACVSRRTIYDWEQKGWVHFTLSPSGLRMICRNSLVSPPRVSRRKKAKSVPRKFDAKVCDGVHPRVVTRRTPGIDSLRVTPLEGGTPGEDLNEN